MEGGKGSNAADGVARTDGVSEAAPREAVTKIAKAHAIELVLSVLIVYLASSLISGIG